MEWVVWVIVGLAVMSGCRGRWARGCGSRERRSSRRAASRRVGSGDRRRVRASRARNRVPAAPEQPESPLETLQRRFVEGAIDIERYEREVDRLYELDAGLR